MKKKVKKIDVSGLTQIALCVALLSASSLIVLPVPFTPVVFSIHTLMVNIIALVMKPARAVFSVAIYIVMGLAGLPVFAGAAAGPDKLFGPTGGFYFGFLVSAFLISLFKSKSGQFGRNLVVSLIFGIVVEHFFAILFMCFYNGFNLKTSFVSVSLPFILTDVIKAVAASASADKISKILDRR